MRLRFGGTICCFLIIKVHQGIKDTIVNSSTHATIHIFRSLGHTGRVYKNKLALEVRSAKFAPDSGN